MRKFVFLLLLLLSFRGNAQSIVTICTDRIDIIGTSGIDYSLIYGDTVTIHAYKKKGDMYNYVIETKDFAGMVQLKNNPFKIEEKYLKRLPNALSPEFVPILNQLVYKVEDKKKEAYKKKALNGQICAKISELVVFDGTEDALGDVYGLEDIHFLGYTKKSNMLHLYAFYTDHAVGVFETRATNRDLIINKINADYLPSVGKEIIKEY